MKIDKLLIILLFVFGTSTITAQNIKITGTVTENNIPLPGVIITVSQTQEGTTTDLNGTYEINVEKGKTLEFSFIGLKTVKYKVENSSTYNLNMVPDTEFLEEVIVLAYGEVTKKDRTTGNAVNVTSEEITAVPVLSFDQALQGKVSGLQITTQSGTPGSISQVRIRGNNSQGAANDPLYVIDGVPVNYSNISAGEVTGSLSILNTLNNEDIQSITVLKDAAATSIYGARGANGVIVVTTKKGVKGKTQYNLISTVGVQNNAVKGPKVLTGKEKMDLWLEANYNSYSSSYNFNKENTWNWYQNFYGNQDIMVQWYNSGARETDWGKEVKRKDAPYYSLNFSAQGGNENSTFYGSLGYDKTESIIKGSDYRKISGSLNITRQLEDNIEIAINTMVSNIQQNSTTEGFLYSSNPNVAKYFGSPWINPYTEQGDYYFPPQGYNIVYLLNNDFTKNNVTRIFNTSSLKYNIIEDLKFETTLSLDYLVNAYDQYNNPNYGDAAINSGQVIEKVNRNFNYVWINSLNYNFRIKENHLFNLRGLIEYQKNKSNGLTGLGQVIPDGLTSLGAAAANFRANSLYTDWSQMSFLGKMNYQYDNRYILEGTIRREGSSKFTKDSRWGNFYSLGLGWNISNESFLIDNKTINTLRLRATIGTTGNSNIWDNQFLELLTLTTYNRQGGLIPTQLGSNVGWEKQTKYDANLEFGLFENRLTGKIGYYQSNTSDMLTRKSVSAISGFTGITTNFGKLNNKGIESEINIEIIKSPDFLWSIGANLSTLRNRITQVPLEDGKPVEIIGSTIAIIKGRMDNEWYLPEFAGVNPDNGNAMWFTKDNQKTEDYSQAEKRFQNANGSPKIFGGFDTHFEYKGFYIDALFTYVSGNKIYDTYGDMLYSTGAQSLYRLNGSQELLNRWQKPGDITNIPKLNAVSNPNSQGYESPSTRFLYDGDYIRLRNLSFGYTFTSNFVKQLKLKGLKLSVTGVNLFTWVKDKNFKYDPEVTGFTTLHTPTVKTVVFTLNVNF